MSRHSGRDGQVFAQIGGGTEFNAVLLTDKGDHLTYEVPNLTTQKPWGDTPAPKIRPNGILDGLQVTVDNAAANDAVDITAGTAFLVGLVATIGAGTVTPCLRPAAPGEVRINYITLLEAGTFAIVAGTSGAPGGARGAAGGPPFVPVGSILVGVVTLFGTAAAPIVAGEIDNTGQERGDIPGFDPRHFKGQAVASAALETIHTGTTTRRVYWTGKKVDMGPIGNVSQWQLTVDKEVVETHAMGDLYKASVSSFLSWSGSLTAFFDSPYWFQLSNRSGMALLKLRTQSTDPYEWVGTAHMSWDVTTPSDGAVEETANFTGNGPIELVAVAIT